MKEHGAAMLEPAAPRYSITIRMLKVPVIAQCLAQDCPMHGFITEDTGCRLGKVTVVKSRHRTQIGA